MKDIKGFLIDLDGVMYVGDRAIKGARESIDFLRERNYTFRFVSNTTRKSRKTIAGQLASMGFDIPEMHIFTPSIAATALLKNTGKSRCYLLTTRDVQQDFEKKYSCVTSITPDFVIVGDAGERITYDRMNTAFRLLMNGANLIALEKDRVLDVIGRSFPFRRSLRSGS